MGVFAGELARVVVPILIKRNVPKIRTWDLFVRFCEPTEIIDHELDNMSELVGLVVLSISVDDRGYVRVIQSPILIKESSEELPEPLIARRKMNHQTSSTRDMPFSRTSLQHRH